MAADDLTTLVLVRNYLKKTAGTELTDDTLLSQFISDASTAIESYTNRDLVDKPGVTRTVAVAADLHTRLVDLRRYDLRTATTVTYDPDGVATVLTAAQYRLEPVDKTRIGTYLQLRLGVSVNRGSVASHQFGSTPIRIVGDWGPTVTPNDVQHACTITAALWYRREVAVRGSGNPDLDLDGGSSRPLALPGAAMRLLAPYTRTVLA
jgi:hypothetical protein